MRLCLFLTVLSLVNAGLAAWNGFDGSEAIAVFNGFCSGLTLAMAAVSWIEAES